MEERQRKSRSTTSKVGLDRSHWTSGCEPHQQRSGKVPSTAEQMAHVTSSLGRLASQTVGLQCTISRSVVGLR